MKKALALRTVDAERDLGPPSRLLLALEGRAFFEWAALAVASPVLDRAPQGDGHPVLVLPGFVAGDGSTWPLRRFLVRRGYAAAPWRLGLNVGPQGQIARRLSARVRALHKQHGRKVSLVGWSLGGAMAHALALRMPELVRSVITLGSPLGGEPKATNAWRLFETISGYRADDPRLKKRLAGVPRVPTTSILSKTDGIVNWRTSLLPEHERSENIEVNASHFGLGANPSVLWAIADRLAQPEGGWKPFAHQGAWRTLFFGDPRRPSLGDLLAP
jgi:pimeloyl-ACP methyl ester carboxylesterase